MHMAPVGLTAFDVDDLSRIKVGDGCTRIDLRGRPGVRAWIVDIEPGAAWPQVDHHDLSGEDVFVVSGEVIEGDLRHGAGTYLHFAPNSQHRPRSEKGVRLFGFNLVPGVDPTQGDASA